MTVNKRRVSNSLFFRTSLVFFLLLLLVGVSYVLITMHYSSRYIDEVNQRLNRNIAQNIVDHSIPFRGDTVDHEAMKGVFMHVMSLNPALEVYLTDPQGAILTYYAPDDKILLKNIDLKPLQTFVRTKGGKTISGPNPRHPNSEKVFSAAPVMQDGKLKGYIYIVLASDEYTAASDLLKSSYIMQVATRSMALTLLAAFVIGLLIIYVITKNLTKILQVMQRFRQGDLTARIHVDSKGELKEVAGVFNEMADILTENIEKLKAVESLRRELIANVSHDLRTPISIIHGFVETMQIKEATLTEEDRRRFIAIVKENTGKLEKLVNELFELSKLEANQVQPKKEPFFISELVNDISASYQLVAREKSITIETNLSRSLPPVYADLALIERVMQNLIDNAIKYTPKGGRIIIETKESDNEHAAVVVQDTGIGIHEDNREQIFARYYKANNYTDVKNSTGLGLAIVRKILDLHNSSLDLVSKVNSGSLFVFVLPVYKN